MRLNNSYRIEECSIPEDMTIADYRRSKAAPRRRWRERAAWRRRQRPQKSR